MLVTPRGPIVLGRPVPFLHTAFFGPLAVTCASWVPLGCPFAQPLSLCFWSTSLLACTFYTPEFNCAVCAISENIRKQDRMGRAAEVLPWQGPEGVGADAADLPSSSVSGGTCPHFPGCWGLKVCTLRGTWPPATLLLLNRNRLLPS